jgi:hypothetical protein
MARWRNDGKRTFVRALEITGYHEVVNIEVSAIGTGSHAAKQTAETDGMNAGSPPRTADRGHAEAVRSGCGGERGARADSPAAPS